MKRITMKKMAAVAAASLLGLGVANAQYATTTNYVNMRSGPGVHYPPITIVPNDTAVHVKACYRYWCNVKYGPWIGWTNSAYLHFAHPRKEVVEIHEQESLLPSFIFGETNHFYYPRHHHHYRHYHNDDGHYYNNNNDDNQPQPDNYYEQPVEPDHLDMQAGK